jgi:hypothetical protein
MQTGLAETQSGYLLKWRRGVTYTLSKAPRNDCHAK